jgi:hypothetical protein
MKKKLYCENLFSMFYIFKPLHKNYLLCHYVKKFFNYDS